MGHHHHHGHSHGAGARAGTRKTLIASLIVTVLFVATEAVAGWWSGSLALWSDAGHNFTDAFGLVLAAAAFTLETRPGNQVKTFGYQRTGVLAAFVNALMLVLLSVFLLWESYQRLLAPEPVADGVMLVVASIGLVVNLAIAWGTGRPRRRSKFAGDVPAPDRRRGQLRRHHHRRHRDPLYWLAGDRSDSFGGDVASDYLDGMGYL